MGSNPASPTKISVDGVHINVYTISMKNITLSAQEELIEKARQVAHGQNSTLNTMFREWLEDVSEKQSSNRDVEVTLNNLWNRTGYFRIGKRLNREEMNER